MGGPTGKRKTHGNSTGARLHKAGVRKKFSARHIDQVWEDVRKPAGAVHDGKTGPLGTTDRAELDEDVPGFGKFYCTACRVKALAKMARPHNQRDAEAAAGMGAIDNGQTARPVSMVE